MEKQHLIAGRSYRIDCHPENPNHNRVVTFVKILKDTVECIYIHKEGALKGLPQLIYITHTALKNI